MDSSANVLGEFERAFRRRLFDSVSAIHLSGGSALAVHLGHRRSLDLDLFATDEVAFAAARASLPVIASSVNATMEILADAPAFRRVLLKGPGGQTLRVDLVYDTAERVGPPPIESGGLRLDPLRELLINKACAILGRSELRDLVDLFFLDRAGFRVVDALTDARRKHAGLTPAQLAWAIGQVPLDRLPDGLIVPVSIEELRTFRAQLVEALERLSCPA
jgi:hypothetical protein